MRWASLTYYCNLTVTSVLRSQSHWIFHRLRLARAVRSGAPGARLARVCGGDLVSLIMPRPYSPARRLLQAIAAFMMLSFADSLIHALARGGCGKLRAKPARYGHPHRASDRSRGRDGGGARPRPNGELFAMSHCGVAENDPRNRGAIEYFRPKPFTIEKARELLTRTRPRASPEEIEEHVRNLMQKMAAGPVKPPAPLSQSLADVADPYNGLGTHPDIIDILWKLDSALPQSCRWVFWGMPALVHPETGVVFAVGYGTIGYVMRLPPHVLAAAKPDQAMAVVPGNPGQTFEIGSAGPEWRFVRWSAPAEAWTREAYDFAGEAL